MVDESVLKILEQATNKNMYEWDEKPDSMHLGRSHSEWEAYWDSPMSGCGWFVVGYNRCASGCCKTLQTHPDAKLKISKGFQSKEIPNIKPAPVCRNCKHLIYREEEQRGFCTENKQPIANYMMDSFMCSSVIYNVSPSDFHTL